MNSFVLEAPQPVFLAADRYVTIKVYSAISGFTVKAIQRKIENGVWVERREFVRAPAGHIFIDREGVQQWLTRGV